MKIKITKRYSVEGREVQFEQEVEHNVNHREELFELVKDLSANFKSLVDSSIAVANPEPIDKDLEAKVDRIYDDMGGISRPEIK